MGTVFSVHVYDHGRDACVDVDSAADDVFDEIERLESMFSTFRADSAISRINRAELTPVDCEREVCDVLDACHWLDHASGGAFRAFRPDDPGVLDPSGFVKGWATERAAQRLTDAGYENWCVNAGGDVLVSGPAPDRRRWRVGIADPLARGWVRATVEITGGAVATSGTAERGSHLWDGRTGRRVAPFASLTVIGPTLTWADAFATAAFAMGETGLEWVGRFDGYQAMAIRADGTIATTNPR
jgi:thiamine biosynthesis lipoprotein